MKKSEFLIGFCFNMRPVTYHYEDKESLFAEFDSQETIEAVSKSIRELGYKVELIEYDHNFVEKLKDIRPNFVFNIVEGCCGMDREAQAPCIYEMLGIPYTGSSPQGQMIALDKIISKEILAFYGIKSAPWQVFLDPPMKKGDNKLKFPLIVKTSREGSSIGIDNNAYVTNFDQLRDRIEYVINTFHQPALVEEFIEGAEFNETIIGNEHPILFPIVEIDYSYLPADIHRFSSFEVKTTLDIPESTICPARISRDIEKKIQNAVLGTYRALRARDYARIDLRVDKHGDVYILEINTIPGIAPGDEENNSMPKAVHQFGWSYTQMISAIIDAALDRYHITFEPEIGIPLFDSLKIKQEPYLEPTNR